MKSNRYSDAQIKEAADINIYDYAQTHGYVCERSSKNEVHIRGYGGLYVNIAENSFFNHSEGKGGHGCISFLQYMEGIPFKQAMEALIGDASIKYEKCEWTQEQKEKPAEFIPPEKSQNYKNLYAYLIKERMLDKDLVSEFVKCGILYQTTSEYTVDDKTYTNNNIVFLHKAEDGTVCGASEQGTKSGKRFKKNYEGTDKDFGFLYKKGYIPNKVVYLFEAPIDLMSFIQLHPEIENAHFVAMEGLKPSIAEHYINDDWRVYSCVDNDAAGKKFNDMILSQKMDEAFGGKCERASISDREPPIDIEYLKAEHNGKQINLFLSDEDYNNYKSIQRCESAACFVWKNKSEFSVITECKENGVKDFNDLLKKSKSMSVEERLNIAFNPYAPAEELAKLAADENARVRVRVAENPNTSMKALKSLANDEAMNVRQAAQRHIDFLSRNKNQNEREPKSEEDGKESSLVKKIKNIEHTADIIENAIVSGQIDIDKNSMLDRCSER